MSNVSDATTTPEQTESTNISYSPGIETSNMFDALSPLHATSTVNNIDVGAAPSFDHGKQLYTHLNDLKTVYLDVTSNICSTLGETSIKNVTSNDIKVCAKIQKKLLSDYLLSILTQCSFVCLDSNLNALRENTSYLNLNFDELTSEISKCVETQIQKYSVNNDALLSQINEQINRMHSLSESLLSNQNNNNTPRVQLQHQPSHGPPPITTFPRPKVSNSTKCFEESINDFVSPELSARLQDFLNNCNKFEENVENGHSVAMFGQPYHYNGSKHSNESTDIPSPITEVIELINQKFPEQKLNSCLVNKYTGPKSFLPRHSDNEANIEPGSMICTVSLGHSATIHFTESHGNGSHEHLAEPNSLYVMSRTSQAFWQHQIHRKSIPENEVRYSMTFRHISKNFSKSTIIIGDSNTRQLKFGTGKGTFGHNMPGKRIEALHITDIDPAECCGYRNIFIHCGINDIKHYKINNRDKVSAKFSELKSKINDISVLCPESRVFVSPILPTKSQMWNQRAEYFNKLLFAYMNQSMKFVALNFNEFCDNDNKLSDDMGKFWNKNDPLHLGSKGISTLVKIIRHHVYSSVIVPSPHVRDYSAVICGHSVSRENASHGAAETFSLRPAAT